MGSECIQLKVIGCTEIVLVTFEKKRSHKLRDTLERKTLQTKEAQEGELRVGAEKQHYWLQGNEMLDAGINLRATCGSASVRGGHLGMGWLSALMSTSRSLGHILLGAWVTYF